MSSFKDTWSGRFGASFPVDSKVVESARYRPTGGIMPIVSGDAWTLYNTNKNSLTPLPLLSALSENPDLKRELAIISDRAHSAKVSSVPSVSDTVDFVGTLADHFQNSNGSNAASSGVAGSPATAEEIMVERNPVQIDGAPITSAVSGIQDQENRLNAWTEMMTNSSHQREVKDLIAAGLNPVLSARYGGADIGSVANVEPISAVAAASGSGRSSKSGFLGLSPVSNPRTPLQMAYNLVVANGDKFVHAAKQIASAASKMK